MLLQILLACGGGGEPAETLSIFSAETPASVEAELPASIESPERTTPRPVRVQSPECRAALARQEQRVAEILAYRNRVMPSLAGLLDEQKIRLAACLADVNQCLPNSQAVVQAVKQAEEQYTRARESVAEMEAQAFPLTEEAERVCRL